MTAAKSDGYVTAEEAIENAPADCVEEDVEGVFGGKVRIRSLTAAQSAAVSQNVGFDGRGKPTINVAAIEIAKFKAGVIKPKFTADQVKSLHLSAGASFAKVIKAIDKISGTSEEELSTAQQEFPGSED